MDKSSIQSSLALMLWKPAIIKKKRCSRASLLLGRHAIMLTLHSVFFHASLSACTFCDTNPCGTSYDEVLRAMIAESGILALPAITLSHLAWQYIHDLQLEVLIPLHFDLIPTGYTVVTNNLAPSSIVLRHRLQPVHPNPRSWRSKNSILHRLGRDCLGRGLRLDRTTLDNSTEENDVSGH